MSVQATTTATTTTEGIPTREVGKLVLQGIPEVPDRIAERTEQYQNTRSAALHAWDYNPKTGQGQGMLISTRFAETSQIHHVAFPGACRKQLTFFKEPVLEARMCYYPDENSPGFTFLKDIGGNEHYQIYHFDLNSGKYTQLTDGKSRNGAVRWSNKGDRFAFHSTSKTDWHVYIGDLPGSGGSFTCTCVHDAPGCWTPIDWSQDDSMLLIKKSVSVSESYLYILDLDKKTITQVPENTTTSSSSNAGGGSGSPVAYGLVRFSKNPRRNGLYYTSDEGSEFKQLRYYDLETKQSRTLTADIHWDVDGIAQSEDGKLLAFTVNEDAIGRLYVMNTDTERYIRIDDDDNNNSNNSGIKIPIGVVSCLKFHPDPKSHVLGFVLNTPQTPGDVFSIDLEAYLSNNGSAAANLTRWTYSEVGGINTSTFVVPELIHYRSFDGLHIPCFYYKPREEHLKRLRSSSSPAAAEERAKPLPVIVHIHGGPESQVRPVFMPLYQYLVCEMGVALLDPNVRGSTGYGNNYVKLDDHYKREDSVKDIGALIDWIETQEDLDSSRVAVWGGSYGGYMCLASMIHYGDRLRCGVDNVGISNFVTFLENTQEYRRDLRRVEYGDERDPRMREFLQQISPLTHAHRLSKPMFIGQGLNDPRVPVTESEQIVKAIRDNGKAVWYMLAKDEGHGFRKKSNINMYQNCIVMFFEAYLCK